MRKVQWILGFFLFAGQIWGQGFERQIPNKAGAGKINLVLGGENPEDPLMLGVYHNPVDFSAGAPYEVFQTFGYYDPQSNTWLESDLVNMRSSLVDLLVQEDGPYLGMSLFISRGPYNRFRFNFFRFKPGDDSYKFKFDSLSYRNIVSHHFHKRQGRYFILVNDSSTNYYGPIRQFNLLEIDTTDFSTSLRGEFEYPEGFDDPVAFFLSEDGQTMDIAQFGIDSIIHYDLNNSLPQSYTAFSSDYDWSYSTQEPIYGVRVDSAGISLFRRARGQLHHDPIKRFNFDTGLENWSHNPIGLALFTTNPFGTINGGHYDADSNLTAICYRDEQTYVYKVNPAGELLFHHQWDMIANSVHSYADGSYYLGGQYAYERRFDFWYDFEPRLVYVDKYGRSQTVIGDESFQVHFQANSNQLKLFLNNLLIQAQYRISDASGRIMQEGAVDTNENLDLGDWRTGIYRIQLWTQTGDYIGSKPFLKN